MLPQANTHTFFLINGRVCSSAAYCKQTQLLEKINNAEQKKSIEEVIGLFDERMYGTSVLEMLFIHSCICSNEKSSVTFQKKHWLHPPQ